MRHRAAPLVVLLACRAAAAQPAAALPSTCGEGVWRLTHRGGAEDDATFSEEWVPPLRQVVGCAGLVEMRNACVLVQGHYDEEPFMPLIVRVFGSLQAAQMVRAGGRAARVVAWLYGERVAGDQLRRIPAPPRPTFRGVEVVVVPNCMPGPAVVGRAEGAAGLVGRSGNFGWRTTADGRLLAEAPAVAPAVASEAGVFPFGRPWIGIAVGADGLDLSPDDVFAGAVGLELGWLWDPAYARVAGGLTVGSSLGQSRGVEATLGVGWAPLSWLQIGPVAGYRATSSAFFSPLIESAWWVGLEAAQCTEPFSAALSVCLNASFAPFGGRSRRAVEGEDGRLFYLSPDHSAERTEDTMRFALGLSLRHQI